LAWRSVACATREEIPRVHRARCRLPKNEGPQFASDARTAFDDAVAQRARADTLRADEHAAFNSEHRAIAAPPMTDPFDAPHSTLVTDRSWAFARESRLSHLALAR